MTKSVSPQIATAATTDSPEGASWQLVLWPHRSLSPAGFTLIMAVLCGFAFVLGLVFFIAGAWPVVGFMGLEILVVYTAFRLSFAAARRHEVITATADTLSLERMDHQGRCQRRIRWPLHWVRVQLEPQAPPDTHQRRRQRVLLSSHGQTAEVGAFLHPAEKPALHAELDTLISRARSHDQQN